MIDGLKTYGKEDINKKLEGKNPVFICTIATTDTSKIHGISGAGASEELNMYTPAADVEIMKYGKPHCMKEIPETVSEGDSAPTPSMLTKSCLDLTGTDLKIVDAGCEIRPDLDCYTLSDSYGKDISTGKGVDNPREIYEQGLKIGKELSKEYDYLVIGESIAAGTTTALGILKALGYDAEFKVSGSMPYNPHELKLETVNKGLKNADITPGKVDVFDAIAAVGDPMMPAVAGMTIGSDVPVVLASGTQMAGVCAVIKAIKPDFDFTNITIATTVYVANDETADIFYITKQISDDIVINVVDPKFETTNHGGLKNYLTGFVKEGAGAGGAMYMSLMEGKNINEILNAIVKTCS